MAAQVLRRAVQDEVGAALEGTQVDRGRGGGVDDDGRRVGRGRLEVGDGQERVRRRLDPDEIGVRGRSAGLVELDEAQAPPLELAEEDACPVVGIARERDRVAGLEQGEDERRRGRRAGREQERGAAVERLERALGLRARRVAVALVVVRARLAVYVRPDRRAVERLHARDSSSRTMPRISARTWHRRVTKSSLRFGRDAAALGGHVGGCVGDRG